MNWSLRALLLMVATVAVALFVIRENYRYHNFVLGLYLLLTTIVIVGSIPRKSSLRAGFLGASIFGVLYLAFVLKGGFGVETNSEAQSLRGNAVDGFALVSLAFMASQLCAMLVWPRNEERKHDEPKETT